jgi:hypothetical protein
MGRRAEAGFVEPAVKAAVENMGGRVILKPVPIAELVRTVAALGKVPA